MRTRSFAIAAALLAIGGCNFDVLNSNQPTQDDLVNNPTRAKLSAAATGLFASARSDIQALIWRLGSMGREGVNLSGNNQPDFQEPYFGPVTAGGSFGGTLYIGRYQHIRSANIYLAAVDKAPDLSTAEKAASKGMAKTLKALAFAYAIETRGQLGSAVAVDLPVTSAPAPWVSEDSVWGYIVGLLNDAQTDLTAAGTADFPFPVPPGLAAFGTPATFMQFNRALAAKAYVFRATAANGCGGTPATCYAAALTALGSSFLSTAPANFQTGAFFDFSNGPGDATNGLSEPLNGLSFYALQDNLTDAKLQTGGTLKDQRVLNKIVPATDTNIGLLGSIPIPGELKFAVFFTDGAADENHGIPIIKDEELVLLRAEAGWFGGNKAQAIADINLVRQNSGGLPATTLTIGSADSAFVTELLYNRRFSLLWEQGTRWIDARRFGRLSTIPVDVPAGNVPPYMPVPLTECQARNLATGPATNDVVTCTPLTP